jgi:DNA-binding NtrC family response regulator
MIVDESVSVLESLKWMFKDEPYYLFVFDHPDDALNIIKTVEFAVVVAEHSVKKMDGIEFLKRVREKSPHTVRIIMTGYTEFKEALDVVYPGCVFRYVKKPLDNSEFRQVVALAASQYELSTGIHRQAALR